jgi:nicotinate dehydrogenase subunit B
MDPIAFRIQNLNRNASTNKLWLEVINAVTQAAGWKPRVAASQPSHDTVVKGRGFAMFNEAPAYTAVVADIEVNKKSGKIVVKHVYNAASAGLTINPGLVENQMVGGLIQTASRALVEQVTFDKTNVTSLDWVTYPILRFKDSPKVTPVLIQHPDLLPATIGDTASTAVVPAIANAFFDATGARLYQKPMTPAVVRATLKAAGLA